MIGSLVRLNPVLPHSFQENKCTLPLGAFFLCSNSRIVTDCIHRRSMLTLLQELECQLPTLAFLAGADGCIITGCIGRNPLLPHGLQDTKCALSLGTFFTCAECCAITDCIHHYQCFALFQELKQAPSTCLSRKHLWLHCSLSCWAKSFTATCPSREPAHATRRHFSHMH